MSKLQQLMGDDVVVVAKAGPPGLKPLLAPEMIQALRALTPDWAFLPKGVTPNQMAQRLEAFGLIEARYGAAGYMMRLTRSGFEASGGLLL